MLTAMTFEFRRNHYVSHRGPSDAVVSVRMPRSLSGDLNALTLAYEEPKYSILLRIIEEYVDSHRDDVEKGRWRMSHYRSEGWDDSPYDADQDDRSNPGSICLHFGLSCLSRQ